ncbi:MAG: class I SAM-dependent methyltransferase [Archangiaceae bacterium]|nr:class I SAM-dependent methyltransferase [Archangiaceae bacterium]
MQPATQDTTTPEFYDEMWSSYGHLDAVSPAAFHRRRVVCQLAKKYASHAQAVLDVGCGMGELLRDLEPYVPQARISGADISERSLQKSRQLNPRYQLFQMDLAGKDFVEKYAAHLGQYDLITCSEVLEHIPEDALAVQRLGQLLKPGGTLIVTVPGGAKSKFDIHIGHQKHYPPRVAAQLMKQNGLSVLEALGWGFPFHSLYRTAVRVASRFAVGDPGEKKQPQQNGGGSVVSTVLGGAYTAFGKVLNPLFYLNLNHGGEQTVVVARR